MTKLLCSSSSSTCIPAYHQMVVVCLQIVAGHLLCSVHCRSLLSHRLGGSAPASRTHVSGAPMRALTDTSSNVIVEVSMYCTSGNRPCCMWTRSWWRNSTISDIVKSHTWHNSNAELPKPDLIENGIPRPTLPRIWQTRMYTSTIVSFSGSFSRRASRIMRGNPSLPCFSSVKYALAQVWELRIGLVSTCANFFSCWLYPRCCSCVSPSAYVCSPLVLSQITACSLMWQNILTMDYNIRLRCQSWKALVGESTDVLVDPA